MKFSKAEKQVLYLMLFKDKIKGDANEEAFEKIGKIYFGEQLEKLSGAFKTLEERKLLRNKNGVYSLTKQGDVAAKKIEKDFQIDRYTFSYLESEKSRAFASYCEKVYGKYLCQINLTNMEEIEKLIEILKIDENNNVLELGCGIGRITEHISDVTGAKLTGIDFADKVIEYANSRAVKKRERLIFKVMDMEELDFPTNSFDTIICIDSLYSVNNLENIIKKAKEVLISKGQMGIVFGNNEKHKKLLQPEETKLGLVLKKLSLKYEVYNLTENIHKLWNKSKKAAEEFKSEFENEGNLNFYKSLLAHAKANLKNIDYASHYIYHIRI